MGIKLTGKETKAKIIDLLVEGKAHYEGHYRADKHYYRNDTKWKLLKMVKFYNLSTNGNVSNYNTDAYRHGDVIRDRFKKIGVQPEIPMEQKNEWQEKWVEFRKDRYDIFSPEEIPEAMKFVDEMVNSLGIKE